MKTIKMLDVYNKIRKTVAPSTKMHVSKKLKKEYSRDNNWKKYEF